jgi:hypothetical protein
LREKILPESRIGKTVSYTPDRRRYLSREVVDARVPVDNNVLDRDDRSGVIRFALTK